MSTVGGFITVTKGHKRCAKRKFIYSKPILNIVSSANVVDLQIFSKFDEVLKWHFCNELETFLCCQLKEKIVDLVCYGLGSFSRCYRAQYQLALLKAIVDNVKKISTFGCLEIFDPMFNESEKTWLKSNDFNVLEKNDIGFKTVSNRTIFYMPHCPRPLYNNVLYANWSCNQLKDVFIIGNSFDKLQENFVSQESRTYRYINDASKICKEFLFPVFHPAEEAFNDLSVHYFQEKTLSLLTLEARDSDKPVYASDSEIITLEEKFIK